MLSAAFALALLVAGFLGGVGSLLLLYSADRGIDFLDRTYSGRIPPMRRR